MDEGDDGTGMTRHRYWLLCMLVALLTGCEMATAPAANTPTTSGTIAAPSVSASPTTAGSIAPATVSVGSQAVPTRTVAAVVPTIAPPAATSDAPYVDPLGRFTITIPKDWQPRAPTNPAGSVLASFDAPDMQASLTVTLDTVPLGTAAKEFAANTEKAIAGKMTNYKRQGQDSLTVGNVPAEALTYTGTVGNRDYLFRQILLVQGTDGWSLTFPLDPAARQRYGPVIDTITQNFAFGRPLAGTSPGAPVPTGTATAMSIVKLPPTALDWKPNTPMIAGVPVRLPDAGIVVQLNNVAFNTKASGKATLGADEQFVIADITIWNLATEPVTPLPEQFSAAPERGTTAQAESAETANDVAGGRLPMCGKVAVPANSGVRFAVVVRVPKQATLFFISYQPGTMPVPQTAQFYVKP